jgi:hypothetical protein
VAVYRYENLNPGEVRETSYQADVMIGVRRFCIFPHKVGRMQDIPPAVRGAYTVDASR